MHNFDDITAPLVRGQISVCRINYSKRDRRHPRKIDYLFTKPNQIQYDWGAVVALLLSGRREYRINAMYIEYENTASPGDPVIVPTFGRDEGIEYYQDLSLSTSRDFLRVPLLFNPDIKIAAGFESYFTEGVDGNQLTFFTQSQGSVGFHGKPFSAAVNSTIFGVSLVATPDMGDPTKDKIFARSYFEVIDQTLKQLSSQVGITWDIRFI